MKSLFLPLFLFVFMMAAPQARAQTNNASEQNEPAKEEAGAAEETIVPFKNDAPLLAVSLGKRTTPLQIASIFHKHAKTEPDFRLWAENTNMYKDALEIDKKEIFTRSYNRIVKSFREINPDRIINVQTEVTLGDYSEIQAVQIVDVFHDKTFFKYSAYDEHFAVIPHELDRFKYLYITPERREEMLGKNGKMKTFLVEFLLKVKTIDSERPQELEPDKDFWLILTDIAEIRMWTNSENNPKLVWRYQADWYDGYVNPELINLYQGQRVAPGR